jgi:hypothetical protein
MFPRKHRLNDKQVLVLPPAVTGDGQRDRVVKFWTPLGNRIVLHWGKLYVTTIGQLNA